MDENEIINIPNQFSKFLANFKKEQNLDLQYDSEENQFLVHFFPELSVEGPPGHVHGGYIATMMDEAMGACAWLSGETVLAAKLEVSYRSSVPLNQQHIVKAQITRKEKRRIYIKAELSNAENKLLCKGTGIFIRIDMSRFKDIPPLFAKYMEYQNLLKNGMSVTEAIMLLEDKD